VDEVKTLLRKHRHPPEHAQGWPGRTRCTRHQQHLGRTRNKVRDHCRVDRFDRGREPKTGRRGADRHHPSALPRRGGARGFLLHHKTADRCLTAKAAIFEALGVAVHLCGDTGRASRRCLMTGPGCRSLRQVLALAFPPQTELSTPKVDVALN